MQNKDTWNLYKYRSLKFVLCVLFGLCLLFIISEIILETKFGIRGYVISKSQNNSDVNFNIDINEKVLNGSNPYFNSVERKVFRLLWYAPPVWLTNRQTDKMGYCEPKNCEVSFNKKSIAESDLVLFSHEKMDIQPPLKRDNQIWVFVSVEPPQNTGNYYTRSRWKHKFDWTMTYRPDSEGYAPYGKILKRKQKKEQNYTALFIQKSGDVAMVSSNCNTNSKREQYVKRMRSIINIDIFGKCGKPCAKQGMECKKHLSKFYKFYLAFENTICEYYSSEKLYRIFNEDVNFIPVVRGAPNIKEMLPSNNIYISTLDFKSPEELARKLKELGSNQTAYIDLLKEKDKYINGLDFYSYGLCSLCEKLNNNFKRKSKLDIQEIVMKKQCFEPTDV